MKGANKKTTYEIDWLVCDHTPKSRVLPCVRFPSFLPAKQFSAIHAFLPTEGWTDSSVYNFREQREKISPYSRRSQGIREKNTDRLLRLRSFLMKPLLEVLRKEVPFFSYLMFREHETEWIWYRTGDFFQVHEDFEKFICPDMVPYVLLQGLETTLQGGETVVYDAAKQPIVCRESALSNGAVFFPSHMAHKANQVHKGQKICLKTEFFLFCSSQAERKSTSPDGYLQVSAHHPRTGYPMSLSWWPHCVLDRVDNFLSGMERFSTMTMATNGGDASSSCFVQQEAKKERKVVLESPDLARSLSLLSCYWYDRTQGSLPVEMKESWEMLFPDWTFSSLQEICAVLSFVQSSVPTHPRIILGNDERAWKWLHELSAPSLGTEWIPLLVCWTRTNRSDPYKLFQVTDCTARTLDKYAYGTPNPFTALTTGKDSSSSSSSQKQLQYLDFLTYRVRMMEKIIEHFEGKRQRWRKEKTKGHHHSLFPSHWERIVSITEEKWEAIVSCLKDIQPSDDVSKPWHHQNEYERQEYEMCNSEDAGFVSYSFMHYVSVYIQIRWAVVKIDDLPAAAIPNPPSSIHTVM